MCGGGGGGGGGGGSCCGRKSVENKSVIEGLEESQFGGVLNVTM